MVAPMPKTTNSAMTSPRLQPAPQLLTSSAVLTHRGLPDPAPSWWAERQPGLVGRPNRMYPQMAAGPKYGAVIGQTASITRIGCRCRRA
jgi:hypothetical protein